MRVARDSPSISEFFWTFNKQLSSLNTYNFKSTYFSPVNSELGYDDFKPLSNNVWKEFNLSPFTYEGVGECKCGDPFILNFGAG